jgi:hypothetical protein
MNPATCGFGCCARATTGQPAAAPREKRYELAPSHSRPRLRTKHRIGSKDRFYKG